MNKIDQNRPFYLKSGSDQVFYVLSGKTLFVNSPLFIKAEQHIECQTDTCVCGDIDSCILRAKCHQDDICYIEKE